MLPPFEGFDWDDGNRGKCEKHGLTVQQIESLFHGAMHVFPDVAHSQSETRHIGIGLIDDGRHVLVAFTIREVANRPLIRPISARFMHDKEITHYESQVQKS